MSRIAQHGADHQEQRSTVQEYDGQIGKTKEPGAEKRMITSESFFGIGVDTALPLGTLHQVGDVGADDQHNGQPDDYRNDRSRRPRQRQKRGPGHHECSPSDHTAESEPPDVKGRKRSARSSYIILFSHNSSPR